MRATKGLAGSPPVAYSSHAAGSHEPAPHELAAAADERAGDERAGEPLVDQLEGVVHHALGAGLVEVAKTLTIVDARQLGHSANRYGRLEEAVIVKVRLAFSPPTISLARAFGETFVPTCNPSISTKSEGTIWSSNFPSNTTRNRSSGRN